MPYVSISEGNYSLSRIFKEIFQFNHSSLVFLSVFIPITFLIIVFACFKNFSLKRDKILMILQDILLVNLGVLLYLLSGPLVWSHYYLLTIPSILFLAQSLPYIPAFQRRFIHVSVIFAFITLSLSCRSGLFGISSLSLAILANIGICVLFLCIVRLFLFYQKEVSEVSISRISS